MLIKCFDKANDLYPDNQDNQCFNNQGSTVAIISIKLLHKPFCRRFCLYINCISSADFDIPEILKLTCAHCVKLLFVM